MSLARRLPGRRHFGALLVLILPPLTAGALRADSIFPNPIYDLPTQASSLMSADVSGDGRSDLVVGEGERLAVYAGLPNGQLGAPNILESPSGSLFTVASGDFNGDGIPDLAQATLNVPSGDGVNVFLGTGGGRFSNALFASNGGYLDDSLASGDFNGDGLDDLAVGSSPSGTIWVMLSLGNGSFGPASIVRTGINGTSLAVADFNSDGHADLAAVDTLAIWPASPSQPGFVRVFPGLGNGTFGPEVSIGVGIFPMWLDVSDLNEDGHTDLAVANYLSATVSILLGAGDGSFGSQAPVSTQNVAAAAVVAGDLDGDGKVDLVIGAIDVLTARGRGDGTFEAPVKSPSWGNATDLAGGDFDGDSRMDVAALNSVASVALLFSNGDGTFGTPAQRVIVGSPTGFNTADFNQDDIPDLAGFVQLVGGFQTGVHVRLGLGNGEFDPVPRVTPIQDIFLLPHAVGDFNRDGHPDLVAIAGLGVRILLGKGDGTFDIGGTFTTGAGAQALSIADLDGDDILDLALASSSPNALVTLKGVGNGAFGPPATLPLDFPPLFDGMTTGDFNGDQAIDLAIAPSRFPPPVFPPPAPANIYVVFGHGDGAFDAPAPFPVGVVPRPPVAADFNDDGIADLAVPDSYTMSGQSLSRGVGVLISHGDGTFAPVSWSFVNPAPVTLAAADFDGDGKQDLAGGKGQRRLDISLLIGRGDGTFRPPLGFGGTLAVGAIVTADFDLDGSMDMAVSDNFSDPAVASIFLSRLTGPEHAPLAVTGGDQNGCGVGGTPMDGSSSVDIDSTPGTNDDIIGFEWFEVIDPLRTRFLGSGEKVSVSLGPGSHTLRLVVTDRVGETDFAEFALVPGVDTTPPDITVGLSPSVLFPANHQLAPVHAAVVAHDSCGGVTVTLESIVSSEPDDAPGGRDGNTTGDIQGADYGTADFDVLLRAERAIPGPGRTYRITYRAVDESGNASQGSATLVVPLTPAQAHRPSAGGAFWSHPTSGGRPSRPPRELEPR